MRIEHEFSVPVPVEQAWHVLLDVERIAPCMPGAALTGIDGDRFTGKVAVKLGPVNLTYQGSGQFVTRDEAQRLVVIKASGQDRRGAGTAAATVTATLHPDGDSTRVTVATDLNITGRAAQYGRGMIADVSAKLTGQFADCLARHLAEHPDGAGTVAGTATAGAAVADAAAGPVAAEPGPVSPAPAAPRSTPPTPATLPVPAPTAGAGSPEPTVLPTGATATQTARATAATPAAPAPRTRPATPSPARPEPTATPPAAAGDAVGMFADDVPATVDDAGYRRIDHPEPAPVDLLDVVGVPDRLRRATPYLLGALAGAVVVWWAMRRRSR